MYVYSYIHMYEHTYVHACVHTYVRTYLHTYVVRTHTHTHTHIPCHRYTTRRRSHCVFTTCVSLFTTQIHDTSAFSLRLYHGASLQLERCHVAHSMAGIVAMDHSRYTFSKKKKSIQCLYMVDLQDHRPFRIIWTALGCACERVSLARESVLFIGTQFSILYTWRERVSLSLGETSIDMYIYIYIYQLKKKSHARRYPCGEN